METSTIDTAINPNTGQPWKFLIAGDPDNSRIYVRIASGLMPPADQNGETPKPRPTLSDVSVLRQWISSCLGGGAAGQSTGTAGPDAMDAGRDGGSDSTIGAEGGTAVPHDDVSGGSGADGSGGSAGADMDAGGRGSASEAAASQPYGTASWKPTASITAPGDDPLNAFDGMITTRWATGRNQMGDESFLGDMGAVVPIARVVLDDTTDAQDFPVAYTLAVSTNNRTFTAVAMGAGSTVTDVGFAQVRARYIRINQTGMTPTPTGNWWSIDELRIYP